MLPYWFIALLTVPGVVAHEMAHELFCHLTGTKVRKVRYFRFGNPAGYVVHDEPKNLRSSFLISVGPLFFNTLLCALLVFLGLARSYFSWQFWALLWIGLSVGMHALPSNGDASSFLAHVKQERGFSLLYAISWLFALSLRFVNFLRFFWIDLVYAVVVGFALPFFLAGGSIADMLR